jgi:hypothetical protein
MKKEKNIKASIAHFFFSALLIIFVLLSIQIKTIPKR